MTRVASNEQGATCVCECELSMALKELGRSEHREGVSTGKG